MRKLIATYFTYSMESPRTGNREEHRGSYLGRKPATERTLRAFLRRNSASFKPRLKSINFCTDTRWIAK